MKDDQAKEHCKKLLILALIDKTGRVIVSEVATKFGEGMSSGTLHASLWTMCFDWGTSSREQIAQEIALRLKELKWIDPNISIGDIF